MQNQFGSFTPNLQTYQSRFHRVLATLTLHSNRAKFDWNAPQKLGLDQIHDKYERSLKRFICLFLNLSSIQLLLSSPSFTFNHICRVVIYPLSFSGWENGAGRLRESKMLVFSPIETSFAAEDKGLEPSSTLDDPFNDLFDQYVRQESSSPSDTGNRSQEFEFFDFPPIDDDTTSSGSNIGDHVCNRIKSPQTARPQKFPQANLRYTQSQEILPSQVYRRLARLETPKFAISSAELLNLEGKRELPIRPSPASPSPAPAAPPLRRKTRFSTISPETLREKNHKISKSPGIGGSDPSKMMRSSYYYRHEMPSFSDCTQQLEQISLQAPFHGLPISSLPRDVLFDDTKRGADGELNPGSSQHQGSQREESDACFTHAGGDLPETAKFNPLSSTAAYPPPAGPTQYPTVAATRSRKKGQHTLPAEQPSSWKQATVSTDGFEFTISPSDIHSDWPPNPPDPTQHYYEHVGASQSAPALAHSGGDFSGPGFTMSSNPFDPFITEDPSYDHVVSSTDLLHSIHSSTYPPIVSPTVTTGRARTPSSRASSPCPSPSPRSKSPSKQRRRSQCGRRKGSAGTLRPANTVGFVNYTPDDSQKILTGVAPSGSSKTKARREQEANEKRRRLSQVAEKILLESGGDLERIRASGLFA